MAPKVTPARLKPVGQAYKDKSKPADVRSSNINAAKGKMRNNNSIENCLVIMKKLPKVQQECN